ncbi:hypothetical protein EsHS_00006586, partial [Epichloe bromicola]
SYAHTRIARTIGHIPCCRAIITGPAKHVVPSYDEATAGSGSSGAIPTVDSPFNFPPSYEAKAESPSGDPSGDPCTQKKPIAIPQVAPGPAAAAPFISAYPPLPCSPAASPSRRWCSFLETTRLCLPHSQGIRSGHCPRGRRTRPLRGRDWLNARRLHAVLLDTGQLADMVRVPADALLDIAAGTMGALQGHLEKLSVSEEKAVVLGAQSLWLVLVPVVAEIDGSK